MQDPFVKENQTLKIAAQAKGKLTKKPPARQQQGQTPKPNRRQTQQGGGEAFGNVGETPEPKRLKKDEIAQL